MRTIDTDRLPRAHQRLPGGRWLWPFMLACLIAAPLRTVQADPLRPAELLLVYNKNEPASGELARYYARVRKVSEKQMLGLRVDPRREEIARSGFDGRISEPIRQYLDHNKLRQQIRCLVTFYGLPIRVGEIELSEAQASLLERRRDQFLDALDAFERALNELDVIGTDRKPRLSARMPQEEDYPELMQRYQRARERARKRIGNTADAEQAQTLQRDMVEVIRRTEGIASLLAGMQAAPGEDQKAARRKIKEMRQAAAQQQARIQQLLALPFEDERREQVWPLIQQQAGLIGLMQVLQRDMGSLRTDETSASVDSELALLWWPRYPKYRWIANTLCWRMQTEPSLRQQIPPDAWTQPVLMVARIDASSPRVARRMIDDALAAERNGMNGFVCIDARGLDAGKGHGRYDQKLRNLAQTLRTHTKLRTKLNDEPELFIPGSCPHTMLYCGWYSLREYIDAFDFVPGSIGYHIGSFEAVSLKDPAERGWCKNMLDDGITATLGPVAEPYLHSFPPPDEFFGLLLTGEFTLAECFAYTNPCNSWMQMLLGDPLYRPFAGRSQLKLEQAIRPDRTPKTFKTPPATVPAP